MTYTAGIYGYQITRPMTVGGLTFEPITTDLQQAKALARNLDVYHLTATVTSDSLNPEMRFNLEGILSFIEHLEVLVSMPMEPSANAESAAVPFPKSLTMQRRNNGGGALVGEDTFFPQSRSKFIELALRCLSDDAFCTSTKFNSLFFKCVETFRQRRPFLEISYFLLYSGLESYARAVRNENDRERTKSSEAIYNLLKSYGFKVYQDKPSELPRAISTYTHLRNALFHNGEFQTSVRMNESQVQLNTREYFFNLSMLVSLTVMKAIQFDDGHINWDAWIDRELFT
jgi:hypothetical protein